MIMNNKNKQEIINYVKEGWSISASVGKAGIHYQHYTKYKKTDPEFHQYLLGIVTERNYNRSIIAELVHKIRRQNEEL